MDGINLIGEIDFKDIKVKIYNDVYKTLPGSL